MTKVQDAYIVATQRTPVGKAPRGAFRHTRPDDLLVHAIKTTLAKVPAIDHKRIDDVIIGCAMPEAEQGMNVARISLLLAGLPDSVPGMTVNRFCSSGLQTVALAAQRIQLGQADLIIAGGTESMSCVPLGGHDYLPNPKIFTDEHMGIAYGMGITAERVAKRWQITREQQDAFALESHKRALAAIDNGDFAAEISPYNNVTHDEGPRADSSLEKLAKLRPVFAAQGSVTAGNSSQMSDGAAAVLVVSEAILKEYNLQPLARFCGYSVAGVAPDIMGIGPVEAIPKVLQQTGLKLADIDWIELNEAFAAQTLAVMQELDLDHAKVNPVGGAIALGHPLGATGAIRTATIIHGLQRNKQKYGMVTMCIGTGMGAAGIFEALV